MAHGQNRIQASVSLFSLIPSLIKFFNTQHGDASGAEKKAAIGDLIGNLAVSTGAVVAANNPQYKDLIDTTTQASFDTMKSMGTLPAFDPSTIAIPGTPGAPAVAAAASH